ASRGARRPGGSGVRVGVAAAPGPGVARAGVPLARALRGPALRLRGDHAGGYMDPVARLRGSCAQLVARGPGDSVLAPHRARAAAGPGHCGKKSVGIAGPDEHHPALDPRLELHLFYNTVVFVPMVVAMLYHLFPGESERSAM